MSMLLTVTPGAAEFSIVISAPRPPNAEPLLAAPDEIKQWVAVLKTTPQLRFKAKDILRAARLALLPIDNPHVASDLKKIKAGKALSPILLVRGDLGSGIALQVADGYHRVCASYHTDENTDIPCRVAPRGPGR